MDKTKQFLKKLKPTTKVNTQQVPTITNKLTQEQKEAALPFLTEEAPKSKPSKKKSISKFFKKIAQVTSKKSEKAEYKLTFIPIVKKEDKLVESTETTEIVWTNKMEDNTKEVAQRIWEQEETENIVEWIGNGKPSSNAILKAYMSHFDFTALKLESAFRNLCSKLQLKGETQQIDRILSEFAGRYFECNPNCIFGSTDVVHAIIYSLLLLNTDLHVAQGDYKKMSRSEFIKNTMNAIQTNTPAYEKDDRRTSGLSLQSFDWIPLQRTPSNQSIISTSTYSPSIESSIPRNMSSWSFGSKTWQLEIKNVLKQMYNNIRSSQITNPSSRAPSINMKRDSAYHPSSPSSIASSTTTSMLQYQSIGTHLQTDLPTTYTSNAPYYKEGMVVRKHLLEKTNQKAKHRDWKECFMVIERSQLCMYRLDQMKRRLSFRSIHGNNAIGGGDWMANATLIGRIELKHALANALPSGYSRQRPHAFALEQANGAVHVFQVGSAEQVEEWVSTCNYWAARESKEPLTGGVSSMEYGWSCLENDKEVMIFDWQRPTPPVMSSLLDEAAQLEALRKHVDALGSELDQHRDIKPKMEAKFSNSKLGAKAMMNWENKSHYLLHEIIKYQNYCNSIEKSLAFQNNVISA